MATSPQEMEDLSKISGSLLVNFGTISDKAGMLEAGIAFDHDFIALMKFDDAFCREMGQYTEESDNI